MNILFQLHHPAHYHLFKHAIGKLKSLGDTVVIVIKEKDVLRELLDSDGVEYVLLEENAKRGSMFGIGTSMLQRLRLLMSLVRKKKIDILAGSTADIGIVGRLTRKPSLVFFEDDFEEVPLYARIVGPTATKLICPTSCSPGKWGKKAFQYDGYHELAYLGEEYFNPDESRVVHLYDGRDRYFLLRFSSLNAYHDVGKKGIDDELAKQIIEILEPRGKVWIVSEREVPAGLRDYAIGISAVDIHHALFYADLYVGDSQTMAAEAAVLGTGSIRYNDFVGRLGYLNELEDKYGLTTGIEVGKRQELLDEISIKSAEKTTVAEKREVMTKMRAEKEDLVEIIVDLLHGYRGN